MKTNLFCAMLILAVAAASADQLYCHVSDQPSPTPRSMPPVWNDWNYYASLPWPQQFADGWRLYVPATPDAGKIIYGYTNGWDGDLARQYITMQMTPAEYAAQYVEIPLSCPYGIDVDGRGMVADHIVLNVPGKGYGYTTSDGATWLDCMTSNGVKYSLRFAASPELTTAELATAQAQAETKIKTFANAAKNKNISQNDRNTMLWEDFCWRNQNYTNALGKKKAVKP